MSIPENGIKNRKENKQFVIDICVFTIDDQRLILTDSKFLFMQLYESGVHLGEYDEIRKCIVNILRDCGLNMWLDGTVYIESTIEGMEDSTRKLIAVVTTLYKMYRRKGL